MRYTFIPEAKAEFDEAFSYYEKLAPRVASHLLDDFDTVINRLLLFPESVPILLQGVRKALLRSFDYNIIYEIQGDEIAIVAFMHQKRKPGYWKKRVIV